MTNRLDALLAREYESGGEKKTAFTKIGAAFETRNGGWSIVLDAMPAPTEGQYKILLMPPRQEKAPASTHPRQFEGQSGYAPDDGDSEIPF